MWTYVIYQRFSFNDLFVAEFWISAAQGSPELIFNTILAIFNLSFSDVELILDKTKTIFVIPYS